MDTIANRIKTALDMRDMKQADLVNITGIGKSSISTYISGEYEPKQKNIYKIAKALDVNEAWLMGYDVPMKRKDSENKIKGVRIPVLGYVRAGVPIDAVEEVLDYEEIHPNMAATGDFFALKIKGDSMEPRITEGDVVIVREQPDVESGEIAIVLVNGDEGTVKKLVKYENGSIALVAFNSAYQPMVFTPEQIETLPVQVIGKVVELRGKF